MRPYSGAHRRTPTTPRLVHSPTPPGSLRFGTPAPWDCELFYVERAALLSGHTTTDQLLDRLLYVYGAWDRSRDPNRLLALAEESTHVLVLLGPSAEEQGDGGGLPDLLAMVHVRVAAERSGDGEAAGHHEEDDGPTRLEVIHVAAHPDVMRMGYGSQALRLTLQYFKGELVGMGSGDTDDGAQGEAPSSTPRTLLRSGPPRPRIRLPPLLAPLDEKGMLPGVRPTSAWVQGISASPAWSLRFWAKSGFRVVGLAGLGQEGDSGRVTLMQDLGEGVGLERGGGAKEAVQDFQRRALRLLSSEYAGLDSKVALGLVRASAWEGVKAKDGPTPLTADEQTFLFSGHDLRRLEMYSKNLVDHTVVADLLPLMGQLLFQGRLPGLTVQAMPELQAAILLGLGMQRKALDVLAREVQLPNHQVTRWTHSLPLPGLQH